MQEDNLAQRADGQVGTVSEPQKGLSPAFHGGSGMVLLCTELLSLAVPCSSYSLCLLSSCASGAQHPQ